MNYSIDKWDSVVNKYNKLSPIIYFKADTKFVEASRRNANFLQVKILNTGSVYDNFNYIFATVDKSPVEGHYTMVLQTEFKTIPRNLGSFSINTTEYVPVNISVVDDSTPSPDYTDKNKETYDKAMNVVTVIALVTILGSVITATTLQGTTSAATSTIPSNKAPVRGVGLSLGSLNSASPNSGVYDKTVNMVTSLVVFMVVATIVSILFGIKPNLNFGL